LLEQGLIHRLERLSAFVGCVDHDSGAHAAQFLICRSCGRVTEIEDHALAHALQDAARRFGFTVGSATIEAEGQCAACAEAARTATDAAPST
ncbi:MAG: transcriptional repressor, partial [Rhodospirillales bacterium]|nr:transcriptional repressor [Rhodospirillales bacterium]